MTLKTLQVSELPILDQVHEIATSSPRTSRPKPADFTVIGHRGNGMNSASSSSNSVKENSILSFNEAGRYPISSVEFDVQVTSDGHPIIFHDSFILAKDEPEKRVTDLSLREFLSYNNKSLVRKAGDDGGTVDWTVENDDALCTLEEAFLKVDPHLGFNIELKFDDDIAYKDCELICTLRIVLDCVFRDSGRQRNIIFSTFQPDAARLVRRLQSTYPVFFLTDGGVEIYGDSRRNSLEEAVKLCRECGLQGIVSEVRAVMRKPWVVSEARELGLGLLTYGKLNNAVEVVYMQHLMGVDGVIVDRVGEITEAVSDLLGRGGEGEGDGDGDGESVGRLARPQFSQLELAFLLRLIPELVRD